MPFLFYLLPFLEMMDLWTHQRQLALAVRHQSLHTDLRSRDKDAGFLGRKEISAKSSSLRLLSASLILLSFQHPHVYLELFTFKKYIKLWEYSWEGIKPFLTFPTFIFCQYDRSVSPTATLAGWEVHRWEWKYLVGFMGLGSTKGHNAVLC